MGEQDEPAPAAARVRIAAQVHDVVRGGALVFGRGLSCDVVLDPTDTSISRTAGSVSVDGSGAVWITNLSSALPLVAVDPFGFRSVLAPSRRVVVDGRASIVVDGAAGSHHLEVHCAQPAVRPGGTAVGAPGDGDSGAGRATRIGADVIVNAQDRLALVALFAGYLDAPPRYDPNPKSYQAAAARLGWPRTTLVKRIEYLRTRLTAAGVPNLQGFKALSHLAEYVLARRILTRDDLRLLNR